MQQLHEWVTAAVAWKHFVDEHPELGYRAGRWPLYNFLRFHRSRLQAADAIRKARNRFWVAHRSRFAEVAFQCATNGGETTQ